MEEVLLNLLHNAAHALDVGGRIQLSAHRLPSGMVEVCVDDDGPGIREDLMSTLFKPFVTSRAEGTGLGLAICRRIVNEHGGTISAEESPAGGARLSILLPGGARG